MNIVKARIYITITATFIAVLFIVLSHFFKNYSRFILSIEVILLPAIYIVGNLVIEQTLHDKYSEKIEHLTEKISEINQKYYKEKRVREELQYKLERKNGNRN